MYCTSLKTLWPQDSVDVRYEYEQYRRKLFSKKFARHQIWTVEEKAICFCVGVHVSREAAGRETL